ncbi:MAG TPA: polysaccharide biosynthesis tyrosine autokinase [Vicinamibacterales bacterium]|nr:polysaccharide biosynthesis tyrosine autokinase [Vicinamibacterales bacterium]
MFEPTSSGAPRSSTTIRTGSAQAGGPAGSSGTGGSGGSGGSGGGPAATPGTPYTPENEVHLLDRLAVLYRYRRLCVTVFILVTAAMIIQGYSSIQTFQAQARLLIEDERSTAVPGLQNDQNTYFEDPEPYYQTQYKILKGRDLTRRVVRKLHLETVPEFNGTKPPPPTPLSMLNDFKKRMMGYVVKTAPEAAPEPPRADETADESGMVGAFIGRVSVDPVRGSHLVDVTFQSEDPKFAADAVNMLIDEYVSENLEIKLRSTQGMLDWLDNELATQQKRVEESERSLAEYREKENALSLDDKQNIVLARLNQLNDRATMAKSTRVQKESLYNQVKAIATGVSPDAIPVIGQNPNVTGAKGKLNELQREKVKLLERYADKHPQVISINASIEDAQRQVDLEIARAVQSVRSEYETALIEEQTFAKNLEGAKGEATDLNRKGIGYGVMEREAKSNRQVYEALLTREKELRVSANSRTNNVRVVDRAEIPRSPITPGGRRTWLMSVVIGLVLAVGVALGLDYMNDTIKTPEDVTRRLKLPFLGLVPAVRGDKHPLLASAHVPHDFGESFRSLRTSLLSKYPDEGTKIVIVTSAQPLEGKTTTAANIAMALAYGGSRVLLVDADMRRPGLHRPLRLTNERGLSQVLTGQARVRDVIQRTVDPNLLAITAGRTPPNPSELLSSERMKTLLTNLAHGPFNWIIIDTPPVLAVTDAVILAPMVTGVTFVIGAEMTRRRLAERAIEIVMQSRPRYAAVVLNKVNFAKNKYYYSRYYGHQYKNYYAEATL